MAYRSSKFVKVAKGRSVLQMALDLHEYNTGAGDLIGPNLTANALRKVIAGWKKGLEKYYEFDTAVYNVIQAALKEFDSRKE